MCFYHCLVEEEPDVPVAVKDPDPTVKGGVYIPPYLRNSSQGASKMGGPGRGMGRRRADAPPDILSSEAFPTLGGAQ